MRQRIALVSEFVLGIFGIYGVGRFVIGDCVRGILELLVVTPVIILVWPMVYISMYGHEPGWIQGATQIIVDVALTWALSRDLKRQRLAKAMAATKEAREEAGRERRSLPTPAPLAAYTEPPGGLGLPREALLGDILPGWRRRLASLPYLVVSFSWRKRPPLA